MIRLIPNFGLLALGWASPSITGLPFAALKLMIDSIWGGRWDGLLLPSGS
jgi:hypothetical protein